MPSAVAVEDFFASQGDFDRAAGEHRQLRHRQLMVERVAFAAEATAIGRSDNSNVARRQFQRLGERAMDVMRSLSGTPESQFPVGIKVCDGGMLLHRQMRVSLKEKDILAYEICFGEALIQIAEFQRDLFMYVVSVAIVV